MNKEDKKKVVKKISEYMQKEIDKELSASGIGPDDLPMLGVEDTADQEQLDKLWDNAKPASEMDYPPLISEEDTEFINIRYSLFAGNIPSIGGGGALDFRAQGTMKELKEFYKNNTYDWGQIVSILDVRIVDEYSSHGWLSEKNETVK